MIGVEHIVGRARSLVDRAESGRRRTAHDEQTQLGATPQGTWSKVSEVRRQRERHQMAETGKGALPHRFDGIEATMENRIGHNQLQGSGIGITRENQIGCKARLVDKAIVLHLDRCTLECNVPLIVAIHRRVGQ